MSGHLIESTVVLAAALFASQLPRLAARTRFAIVYAALLKFAIPSSLVTTLGIALPRTTRGTILVTMFGRGGPRVIIAPASLWPPILGIVWATIALALLAVTFVRGRRAVAAALHDASDAAPRAHDALERARSRARLTTPIALVASPSVLAPAAVGVIRPTIVLPSSATLDDDELESILTHEVAHVARRDNFLGLIESLFAAALWFHPLVWIARRVLAATREAACDDVAVAAANRETYLSALTKICSASVAPRGAGISCIGGNTLKERMEVLMRNPFRTLPHRVVTAAAVTVIAAFTFGSGIVRATPQNDSGSAHRYKLDVAMTRDTQQATFHAVVTDTTTNTILAQPQVSTPIGVKASVRTVGDPTIVVTMLPNADGTAECEMTVSHDGKTVARMGTIITPKDEPSHGDGITLQLKDADLRDVLATFEKLANVTIDVDAAVHGKTTINLKNVAWQTGLRLVVEQAGYKLSKESETHFSVR